MTGVMAAPKRKKRSDDIGASSIARAAECGAEIVAPAMISMAMAASLSTISTLCVLLPLRTPRQLISVRMSSVITAIVHSGTAIPIRLMVYLANVAATAAIPPLCTMSRSAQPYMNATEGW